MKNLLIVFVKYPQPGQVKTRLAGEIDPDAAAAVYRNLVALTLERTGPACPQDFDRTVHVDPMQPLNRYRHWLPHAEALVPQRGDCLGERMLNAFCQAFLDGYQRVVLIGSDCPDVCAAVVKEAFDLLADCDAVLGPALDGGYYLLALSRPIPQIFEGIDWSTDRVAQQTLERLDATGASRVLLPVLRDVDRAEDVNFYRQQGYAL